MKVGMPYILRKTVPGEKRRRDIEIGVEFFYCKTVEKPFAIDLGEFSVAMMANEWPPRRGTRYLTAPLESFRDWFMPLSTFMESRTDSQEGEE